MLYKSLLECIWKVVFSKTHFKTRFQTRFWSASKKCFFRVYLQTWGRFFFKRPRPKSEVERKFAQKSKRSFCKKIEKERLRNFWTALWKISKPRLKARFKVRFGKKVIFKYTLVKKKVILFPKKSHSFLEKMSFFFQKCHSFF